MMKLNYDQIKAIITERLKHTSLEAYRLFLTNSYAKAPIILSDEEVHLLSPDNVNCNDFWKVLEDLFSSDPVCNTVATDTKFENNKGFSIMESNRRNLGIVSQCGFLHYIDEYKSYPLKTLEIGVGYGSLKNYIEINTRHEYFGFDVLARTSGVHPLSSEGMFLPEISKDYNTFRYVISSNVFQHLSTKQRKHYFEEGVKLLLPRGLFMFNCAVITPGAKSAFVDNNGINYVYHYGQCTPIQTREEIIVEMQSLGMRLLSTSLRFDQVAGFVFEKI